MPIRQRYVNNVKLDTNGNGAIEFTMRADFLLTATTWTVTGPNGAKPVKQSTAVNTIAGDDFEGTYSGNQDTSGTVHMCGATEVIRCEWTGGDANATATLTLRGIEYPAGEGMKLYAAGGGGFPSGGNGPSNPVVGGNVLIRDAIQSRDFVAGVSGWQVAASGSAEFSNAAIRGTFETDGANGAYVRIVNIVDPSTGIPESVIIFRPANTTGLVPDWLPDADIGTGMIRAYGDSASGLLGRGQLVTEIDGVAWATGVGAPTSYPVVRLATATFDGGTQPNPTIALEDNNAMGNVDIGLNGNVFIGASGKTVTVPGKFGRENALINFPNTLTAVTGVTLGLAADVAVFNNFAMWNAGTPTRITVPRNGQYEVGMYVRFTAQAVAAGLRFGIIQQNGATIADKADPTTTQQNTFVTSVLLTQRVQAAAGDFFTFSVFQNSGANLAIQTPSRAWVELIEST